ncbi:MAG: DUF2325 domain-containing protein [Rhodospirillum sp.]|nr:DUF2325 domain-containing protein [Rhodospirillum sp.]MCF8491951.1 DUF2325 domain-containing protein [Rhodospirillum sp.]MCF8501099.1 DUF2325 domain-containing protein [Rhodospirillum sp.]
MSDFSLSTPPLATPPRRACGLRPIVGRKRLWELDPHFHCSLVGTCLALPDLRKMAAKARVTLQPDTPDYRLHGMFTRAAAAPGSVEKGLARLMDKALEKRHARALALFRRAGSIKDLETLWSEALKAGDIPGPYWALMSHPLAPKSLLEQAFGEVHMLSHLVGASNRADVRRLAEMELTQSRLETDLASTEARRQRDLEIKQGEIAQLREALEEERGRARAMARRLETLGDGDSQTSRVQALEATMEGLRDRLNREAWRADRLQGKLSEAERRLSEAHADRDALRARLGDRMEDLRSLEAILHGENRGQPVPPPDLGGRTLLYVGGRARAIPGLRKLVETSNGHFLHHDAGREDGRAHLSDLLASADMVVCPVDCISHDACLKCKRACKDRGTPFAPLPSSGMGAFARYLREVAPPAPEVLAPEVLAPEVLAAE